MKSREMEIAAADDVESTPASAFVMIQGKALLDVLLAISSAADIELDITVSGKRDGVELIRMRTTEKD